MKWLRNLFPNLFIRHTWVELDDDRRRCTVCGRLEKYDEIGSVNGSVWDPVWGGDRRAHH